MDIRRVAVAGMSASGASRGADAGLRCALRGIQFASTMGMRRITWLFIGFAALAAMPVAAQGSRCADCHIANLNTAGANWTGFAIKHLQDWDRSPHETHNVGCEKCHGGNASSFEPFLAHQGMLHAQNPASPVNRANLPKTCGTCHTGPFVSFQKSRHYALLGQADSRGPTCTTCHSEVAAMLLSPRALESQCNACHGPGKPQARPERAAEARLLMTEVTAVRSTLSLTRSIIKRITDKTARASFDEAWRQAVVPLIEARNAGHEFVFDNLKERLERAKARADALMDRLANGSQ